MEPKWTPKLKKFVKIRGKFVTSSWRSSMGGFGEGSGWIWGGFWEGFGVPGCLQGRVWGGFGKDFGRVL